MMVLILEETDAKRAHFLFAWTAHRHGRGGRVTDIRAGHRFEQKLHIAYGASQRPHDSELRERPGAGRKVTSSGDASRCRLQSTNAGIMRGHPNGSASIAAHPAR